MVLGRVPHKGCSEAADRATPSERLNVSGGAPSRMAPPCDPSTALPELPHNVVAGSPPPQWYQTARRGSCAFYELVLKGTHHYSSYSVVRSLTEGSPPS